MSLRTYLFIMSLGTCLCWVAWFFVITNLAPGEAGFTGLLFFYTSLFLALVGTCSVIGFLIRQARIKNSDIVFRQARHIFRQSILLGSFLVIILILKASGLLSWWVIALVLIIFLIIEGLLSAGRKYNNVDYA